MKEKQADRLKKCADELSDIFLIPTIGEESQIEKKYNEYISTAIECILKAKLCLKDINL